MVIKIDQIWEEARLRLFEPAVKVGLKQKLRNERWAGPFQILRLSENHNVTIRLGNGKDYRVHTDRIKHAEKQRNVGSEAIGLEPVQLEQQTKAPIRQRQQTRS